jgi:hypothetical protein
VDDQPRRPWYAAGDGVGLPSLLAVGTVLLVIAAAVDKHPIRATLLLAVAAYWGWCARQNAVTRPADGRVNR